MGEQFVIFYLTIKEGKKNYKNIKMENNHEDLENMLKWIKNKMSIKNAKRIDKMITNSNRYNLRSKAKLNKTESMININQIENRVSDEKQKNETENFVGKKNE